MFIKLTSLIINTKYINKILISSNKYYIYLANNKISGNMILYSSTVPTDEEEIQICSIKDPQDYKIVSEWIKKM